MNIIKKFSAGAWITLAAVMALVSVTVYAMNIGSAGYFQNTAVSNLVPLCLLVAAALLAAVVLGQLELPGSARTAMELVRSADVKLPEMLLGYFIGPFGALLSSGIFTSFLNKYLTDVLRLDTGFLSALQLVSPF